MPTKIFALLFVFFGLSLCCVRLTGIVFSVVVVVCYTHTRMQSKMRQDNKTATTHQALDLSTVSVPCVTIQHCRQTHGVKVDIILSIVVQLELSIWFGFRRIMWTKQCYFDRGNVIRYSYLNQNTSKCAIFCQLRAIFVQSSSSFGIAYCVKSRNFDFYNKYLEYVILRIFAKIHFPSLLTVIDSKQLNLMLPATTTIKPHKHRVKNPEK